MIHCFKCNNNVPDDMTFCTNCGEKLVVYGNDFVIPNIGKKADDEVETVIRPAAAGQSPDINLYTPDDEFPKSNVALKIGLAIAGLIALGFGMYQFGRSSAEPVSMMATANVPTPETRTEAKFVTATPTPVIPTPTPTPKKVKPRYIPDSANDNKVSNQAIPNYSGPLSNIPPPRITEFDRSGRRLRAICKNGEPSYWQYDKWATCGMNGGVFRWNPNHPRN